MSSNSSFGPRPTVQTVVECLDAITGGRVITGAGDPNPWAVVKDSGIPGKGITERPGLVWGRPEKTVRRLAVAMSLTEHDIELAQAMGVDAIVAHHPVADAASSGGVSLDDYLSLYDIAILECHEAFHGLHPGIARLHGHEPYLIDPVYGGVPGQVVMVGRPLDGVRTLGDVLRRLDHLLERSVDSRLQQAERDIRGCSDLVDSVVDTGLCILNGDENSPLGSSVLHVFPHTGFDVTAFASLLKDYPDIGTLIFSISSATPKHPVVLEAVARGLNVLIGSTHASEILENGLPLGYALSTLLPEVDVILFRSRVVAIPLHQVGSGPLRGYGATIASENLLGSSSQPPVPTSQEA